MSRTTMPTETAADTPLVEQGRATIAPVTTSMRHATNAAGRGSHAATMPEEVTAIGRDSAAARRY
ncbi:hypothetical protein ACL03H_23135 [Saccharopolyspora sp. MS10]|uniref:hypothetical protein n=1 Tax=Saccharopolyspora sp. MS10 TaxID=3385973 RepID=UPI0039A29B68